MAARGGAGRGGGRGARRGPGGLEAENKFKVSYDPKPTYPVARSSGPREMERPPPRIDADDWEAECVMYMRDINRRRKLEPYYVPAAAGDARVSKSRATTATAKFNPFTGPATYSQKYHAPVRTAPDFTGKSWLKKHLPLELQHVVDPTGSKPAWFDEHDKRMATVAAANVKKPVKGITNLNLIDGNEEEEEEEDPDKEAELEEQDENWEEDEDEDMDYEKGEKDDYNAEQYFDNGEDDGEAFGGDADGGDY
ncbi:DNA-directed RNA polymerase III [Venturia nashicola]|uniref:DNA-directed RNA polymerase III n=1 Tax=Venturia nashicola TaxID=86259 RepID=A0A4Z1PQ62_9PEZI|nr:DNA-directed RNA polymerase III [Venturia nashicola]